MSVYYAPGTGHTAVTKTDWVLFLWSNRIIIIIQKSISIFSVYLSGPVLKLSAYIISLAIMISPQPERGPISTPTLKRRRVRLREVMQLVSGHTASAMQPMKQLQPLGLTGPI